MDQHLQLTGFLVGEITKCPLLGDRDRKAIEISRFFGAADGDAQRFDSEGAHDAPAADLLTAEAASFIVRKCPSEPPVIDRASKPPEAHSWTLPSRVRPS